jgi:GxxExxY protein
MEGTLLHEELTGKIRQVAFEIHRYFMNGFLEKVYENALVHRLRKLGLKVQQQVPVLVKDEDGTPVGEYFADLVVEDVVIVELKSAKTLTDEHLAQLINYLKATDYDLGLLINFGSEKFQFKRVAYSECRTTIALADKSTENTT